MQQRASNFTLWSWVKSKPKGKGCVSRVYKAKTNNETRKPLSCKRKLDQTIYFFLGCCHHAFSCCSYLYTYSFIWGTGAVKFYLKMRKSLSLWYFHNTFLLFLFILCVQHLFCVCLIWRQDPSCFCLLWFLSLPLKGFRWCFLFHIMELIVPAVLCCKVHWSRNMQEVCKGDVAVS